MSRYTYTKFEKQMNNVLKYQDERLKSIHFPLTDEIESTILSAEVMLRDLGYQSEALKESSSLHSSKKIMVVPAWEELCAEVKQNLSAACDLEDLFTEAELKSNEGAIFQLNKEFKMLHHMDSIDITIAALAGIIGAAVDILFVGVPQKSKTGLKAGALSDYIREYFDRIFPEEEMQKLANAKVSKVPYDAQDNRHTKIYVEGLSAYYHRLLQLGHDPLLGFVFGVADILTGRMTTIDKAGNIVSQTMENYTERRETTIFAAIVKQILHFKSDITTSMGLPAPLMGLFNLLQFGSIGEEEQTIAEIVQGMYFEGYDFIHFCSMSVSAMLVEAIVRIGYAIKKMKEGHSIKDSIPVSLNRRKHPKLATMLFIAHSAATVINAEKVYFTKNPVAINYPEWLAFAKYSYKQLKWGMIQKPKWREAYVLGRINEELNFVFAEAEANFEQCASEYTIIFH